MCMCIYIYDIVYIYHIQHIYIYTYIYMRMYTTYTTTCTHTHANIETHLHFYKFTHWLTHWLTDRQIHRMTRNTGVSKSMNTCPICTCTGIYVCMSAHMQLHTKENMSTYGGFHQLGIPKMDGFRMENPIKIVDLGVPPFRKPPICQGTNTKSRSRCTSDTAICTGPYRRSELRPLRYTSNNRDVLWDAEIGLSWDI